MIFTNLIQANLKTRILGHTIEYYPFTESTNVDVWKLVEEGESPEGMLVLTDDQRNGKGRRENEWHSSPGKNLTFSLLVKPEFTLEQMGLVSLLAGVSVCEGIQKFCRLSCTLKWPNDIIINGRKTGGTLIENKEIGEKPFLCVGVGLNVNETSDQFPPGISRTATSLFAELGHSVQREPLLAEILNCFESYYPENMGKVKLRWLQLCNHSGRKVEFRYGQEKITGVFKGINQNGYAEIEVDGQKGIYSCGVIKL